MFESNNGGDGKRCQPISDFIRHEAGVGDGGVEEYLDASRRKRAERVDDGVQRPVRHGGPPEAAVRRGRVPRDIVIGKKKREPPEVTFYGDEHVVPVHPQRPPAQGLGGKKLFSAKGGCFPRNDSPEKGIAFDAGEPILISYELERGFFRIAFLTEESVVIK